MRFGKMYMRRCSLRGEERLGHGLATAVAERRAWKGEESIVELTAHTERLVPALATDEHQL